MRQSTIIPALRYRDAPAAIAWLGKAFGLQPQAVFEGPNNTIAHAQLTLGDGMIMLASAASAADWHDVMISPDQTGGRSTASLCLIVPDAAAVYATAKSAGAVIFQELQDMDYGGKAFGCKDLEGHAWSIGEYDPWA